MKLIQVGKNQTNAILKYRNRIMLSAFSKLILRLSKPKRIFEVKKHRGKSTMELTTMYLFY